MVFAVYRNEFKAFAADPLHGRRQFNGFEVTVTLIMYGTVQAVKGLTPARI